ncbi:MAG: diguanylate cyclase [Deltaproteobacteria bacterium]
MDEASQPEQVRTFERHTTNRRVIADLKKRSLLGLIFYILVAFVVVLADKYYERHAVFALIFLLANAGICLFRVIHMMITRKMGERYEALNKAIFLASVILTALIWGVALAMIMLQPDELVTQLIMTVCISGLCAGGVVAFIPYRRLAVFYNFAMLMPVVIIMLFNGINLPLASMLFLFSAYMVLIAFRGNREYWDALENEYLLEIKSQELTRLSHTDVLTGLFNRRYFDDALDREWKRSGRDRRLISVILLDIDYFKKINDTYGHQAGDEFLKKTAEALSSVFKRVTDIVARYGGEEFIVLIPDGDAPIAIQLAGEAVQKIGSILLNYQGQPVRATISAGVNSRIPDFSARSDSIVAGADKALYLAKQRGRNQVAVFESENRQPGA